MRHQKKRHKLGRTTAHRKRTLQALSSALIEHKRITTTEAKAKALRPFVEPLITRAKDDTSHNRRQVFRKLQDKHAVSELFTEVAVEVGSRPGGYTRVIKLGRRPGDGAEMAMIELVDYNDVQPETGGGRRKRTRRGGGKGRRRKKNNAPQTQEQAPEATTTETSSQQPKTEGIETETVEEPVPEAQKTPVSERTEPQAEAKAQAEAVEEERAEEQQEEGGEDEKA